MQKYFRYRECTMYSKMQQQAAAKRAIIVRIVLESTVRDSISALTCPNEAIASQ
jgi:hypothetical protein